jgi:hypothetical protein
MGRSLHSYPVVLPSRVGSRGKSDNRPISLLPDERMDKPPPLRIVIIPVEIRTNARFNWTGNSVIRYMLPTLTEYPASRAPAEVLYGRMPRIFAANRV